MMRTLLGWAVGISLACVVGCGGGTGSGPTHLEGSGGTSTVPVAGGAPGAGGGGVGTGGTAASGGRVAIGGTASTGGLASTAGGAPGAGGSRVTDAGTGSGGLGVGGSPAAGGSAGCPAPMPGTSSTNPLFTDQFTADPAPLVHGCTFYITCGHDEGQNGFSLREWFLLSSTDMVHWTKNVALRVSDFAWANANAWAGQMVTKNGKFYWYVPVNQRGGGMAIGVAVADSPTGPFVDAKGEPLVDDAFEMSNMGFAEPGDTVFTIDPTVLVDDDGAAHLHYGGFGRMVVARLGEDMISIDGVMREATPRGFFEAPFLIERNGVYYEIYAAGINPAAIDYATSENPMGPWTYGGRILDPLPNVPGQDAATNHAGVAEFAGQWYLVYHVSDGPNGGGTYRREVAVEKLNFEADGSIGKVTRTAGIGF